MPAGYPDGTALQDFLQPVADALRVTLPAGIKYQSRIDSAKQKFEGVIGRRILATTQTRSFDPPISPRLLLDLRTDLLSVSSLTIQGVAQVAATDYWLEPFDAPQDGKPYRRVEFAVARWGWAGPPITAALRRCIVITGSWGYSATVPDQVYDAILAQGAIDCYPELALAVSRGLQMKREGDVEAMYARGKGNGPLFEEMSAWQLRVADAINNYLCVEVGL